MARFNVCSCPLCEFELYFVFGLQIKGLTSHEDCAVILSVHFGLLTVTNTILLNVIIFVLGSSTIQLKNEKLNSNYLGIFRRVPHWVESAKNTASYLKIFFRSIINYWLSDWVLFVFVYIYSWTDWPIIWSVRAYHSNRGTNRSASYSPRLLVQNQKTEQREI